MRTVQHVRYRLRGQTRNLPRISDEALSRLECGNDQSPERHGRVTVISHGFSPAATDASFGPTVRDEKKRAFTSQSAARGLAGSIKMTCRVFHFEGEMQQGGGPGAIHTPHAHRPSRAFEMKAVRPSS
jgi:hypothetical protein